MTEKTEQLHALESIQEMINDLPEGRRLDVMTYAEDIRDILAEGQGDAFLALTLVSCEFAATSAEMDKEQAEDDTVVAG